MLFKRSPFFDTSEGMVWNKIKRGEVEFYDQEYKVKNMLLRVIWKDKWQSIL